MLTWFTVAMRQILYTTWSKHMKVMLAQFLPKIQCKSACYLFQMVMCNKPFGKGQGLSKNTQCGDWTNSLSITIYHGLTLTNQIRYNSRALPPAEPAVKAQSYHGHSRGERKQPFHQEKSSVSFFFTLQLIQLMLQSHRCCLNYICSCQLFLKRG